MSDDKIGEFTIKRKDLRRESGPTTDLTMNVAKHYTLKRLKEQESMVRDGMPDWEYKLINTLPNKLASLWLRARGYVIIYGDRFVALEKRGERISEIRDDPDYGRFSPML